MYINRRTSFALKHIKEKGEMKVIILFPLPFQGHINPMLHLAQILHSKGFSITIIHTHFNSLIPSNHPNFILRSIPDGLLETELRGSVVELITCLNNRCVEAFRKCVAELAAAAGDAFGCLITDAHWHFTQGVADELGIKRIVLRTGNICSSLIMFALPALRSTLLLPSSSSGSYIKNLEDPVPDFPNLRVKDLPIFKDECSHLLDRHLSSIFIQTKASSGLIFNSFDHHEPELLSQCRQLLSPVPIFLLGPFHKHLPLPQTQHHSTILSWLNTKPPNSVLYISFGTIAAIESSDFIEIAIGLANSSHTFLWVVRPGLVRGCKWLEALPEGFEETVGERGLMVKWAPQKEVLAHPAIGGFWTHTGWNSTIESICEGVPMLCYPCFGDQMPNARYVSHVWGIGVVLEGKLQREEIEKGIKKLMSEKENGNIKKRIKDFKHNAQCCIKEGGSTFQSLHNFVHYILNI